MSEIYGALIRNICNTDHQSSKRHELVRAVYPLCYCGMFLVCESGISHKTTRHSNVGCVISPLLLTRASCIICYNNKEYTHTHTHFLCICVNYIFRQKYQELFLFFTLSLLIFWDKSYLVDCYHFTEYNLGKSNLGATGLL